jgi:arylsulfatase A-like enzyme
VHFVFAVSYAWLLSACAAREEEPPNILFAFADDWGKYAGCYAVLEGADPWQGLVNTPHVDRIAKEGVLFDNAFVTAPSCTPCRSSILSGQYFFRTGRGAILQGAIWDESIPTYPLMLEQAGYHIGYTYKVWSPGTPRDAGYGGDRTRYEPAGRRFCQFSQHVAKMMAEGKAMEEAKAELYREVRDNFSAFLDANDTGKPFCYWWGPTNTHRKWIAGSGKSMWGIDPEGLEGKLPPFLPDVDTVREDFADYLGEVAAFDTGLGVLLDMLEERGQLDNTLIVVSGDHGIPGFPYGKCNLYDFGTNVALAVRWPSQVPAGRVVDDFVNLMDLAPTFLEAGRVEIPDVMTGRSILPVLQSHRHGLVDIERTFVVTGRERHVARARQENRPYPQRALRTLDYLYIINFEPDRWPMGTPNAVTQDSIPSFDVLANNTFVAFADLDASPTKAWIIKNKDEEWVDPYYQWAFGKRPMEELYYLRDDPYQINNIAENPAYGDVLEKMHDKLMSILQQTEDPRVTGAGDTFEKSPYTDVP